MWHYISRWASSSEDKEYVKSAVRCYYYCSILQFDLDKQRGTLSYKNTIWYFYFSTVKLVWTRKAIGESLLTQSSCLDQPAGTDFSQNSRPYVVLKLSRDPHWPRLFTHPMLVFHCSWFTTTQCLFSTGHGKHPRITCFPVITLLTLSSAGFIAGQGNILHNQIYPDQKW